MTNHTGLHMQRVGVQGMTYGDTSTTTTAVITQISGNDSWFLGFLNAALFGTIGCVNVQKRGSSLSRRIEINQV